MSTYFDLPLQSRTFPIHMSSDDTSSNHEISYSPHAYSSFRCRDISLSYEKHVLSSMYSFMQSPFALPHTAPLFDSVLAARSSIAPNVACDV